MNDHDKGNLEFLMSLRTEQDWNDWWEATTEDDHQYALELIVAARLELSVRTYELLDEIPAGEEDLTLAKQVLSRYTLTNKGISNGNYNEKNKRA